MTEVNGAGDADIAAQVLKGLEFGGSAIKTSEDQMKVIGVFVGSIVFFSIVWKLMDVILLAVGAGFYVDRDENQRIVWRDLAINNVHNVMVVFIAYTAIV